MIFSPNTILIIPLARVSPMAGPKCLSPILSGAPKDQNHYPALDNAQQIPATTRGTPSMHPEDRNPCLFCLQRCTSTTNSVNVSQLLSVIIFPVLILSSRLCSHTRCYHTIASACRYDIACLMFISPLRCTHCIHLWLGIPEFRPSFPYRGIVCAICLISVRAAPVWKALRYPRST